MVVNPNKAIALSSLPVSTLTLRAVSSCSSTVSWPRTGVSMATLTEVLVMTPITLVSCNPEHIASLSWPHLLT